MRYKMFPLENEVSQVLQTKYCFYEALFKLVESRKFADITVGQICKKADYSRATFYKHYSSKEDFLHEIFVRIITYYKYKIAKADREGRLTEEYTHTLFLKLLQFHKEYFFLLENTGNLRFLVDYLISEHDDIYRRMSCADTPHSAEYRTYFLRYHAHGLTSIYMNWLHEENPLPISQFWDIVRRLYQYDVIRLFLQGSDHEKKEHEES